MNHYLYASQVWRARNCPGSVKATRTKYEGGGGPTIKSTEEAKYGRELHKLTEEVIDGKLALETIHHPERGYVERCLEFLSGRELRGETEKPLFVLVAGKVIASCRADLIDVNLELGEVAIADWKFYHAPLEEAEWNLQGLTMCVAALQAHPECHSASAVAFLPILNRTYELRLDQTLLEEAVLELYGDFQAINAENPKLRTGPWCMRCEALLGCPAAQATITDLAESAGYEPIRGDRKPPTVEVLAERYYNEIERWSRGRFLAYVDLLPFLPALTQAVRRRLKEELRQGVTHTHYQLFNKRNPRKASVRELRDALGDLLSPDEFDDVCDPSWGRLGDLLKKKGLSIQNVRKLLEPFETGWHDEVRRV